MNSMVAMVATVACVLAVPVSQAEESSDATLERRLEEAHERLEAAAREVAELSAEAGGPAMERIFEMHLPGSGRAMLGINLGGAEPNGEGVRVHGVSPGGPAAEAGIQRGDAIISVDGQSVATGRDVVAAMESVEPGQKVALELRRDGKTVKATVTARSMQHLVFAGPGMGEIAVETMGAHPPLRHGMAMGHAGHWLLDDWSDAELVTVTPALGRYFGTDQGVLVARAPDDSTLGLQDGDVIVAIGGREPQNGPHAMRILRSYQPGETVELRILRDRKTQSLKATVPERKSGHAQALPVPPRPPTPPVPPREPAGQT